MTEAATSFVFSLCCETWREMGKRPAQFGRVPVFEVEASLMSESTDPTVPSRPLDYGTAVEEQDMGVSITRGSLLWVPI